LSDKAEVVSGWKLRCLVLDLQIEKGYLVTNSHAKIRVILLFLVFHK
jgi:hypothetical protein